MKEKMLVMLSYTLMMCGCDSEPPNVVGTWYSEKASIATISFYQDGTASFSGTGLLGLHWKFADSRNALVAITALDSNVVMHFQMYGGKQENSATLSIAGVDTTTWRKRENN